MTRALLSLAALALASCAEASNPLDTRCRDSVFARATTEWVKCHPEARLEVTATDFVCRCVESADAGLVVSP